MYRTSGQHLPTRAESSYRTVLSPGDGDPDGPGRVYSPIDPFKASIALGIRNVFGRTKDRTIDEVPVQRSNSMLQAYPSRVPPSRNRGQHHGAFHDRYHEMDAPYPQHHDLGGDYTYAYPATVPRPASSVATQPVVRYGREDENTTKAFVPQGLLAAGIRDRKERLSKDREALARPGDTLSYSTGSNKPPTPQTGLLGAITAHDRETIGVGASLTERKWERCVAEERQRRAFNEPPVPQTGLLGAVIAHEREGVGLGLPLTEREPERWAAAEWQQQPSNNPSLPQTGLLRAILADEEQRAGAPDPMTERETERRIAEERQRRFDELQAEAHPDRTGSPPTTRPSQIPPMERRSSSKIRHTEPNVPPSTVDDDSETTEERVWGKTRLRPKRNWKELESVEGPAAAPKTPPPVQEPIGEVPAIQALYERFQEAGMADAKEGDQSTGRAAKTGRRLAARVGDLFNSKSKPIFDSPSAAEYPSLPEYMGDPMGHPDVKTTWFTIASSLFLDVIPRQVYLHLLLRFPALYFSRVTRIFQDANLGMGEIKRMALEAVDLDKGESLHRMLVYQGVFPQEWCGGDGKASVSYMNLRSSWQGFIDSLMREWKTLNIVSVLLLSAILTILQIDSAASNPLTRFSALLSLVCAFMSLIYGCLYIIRFGTMRKTHKAAEWANESERTSTSIFWNVWVMLAMPVVWLGWSMIFYIVCIMSFVWQTGTTNHPRDYTPTDLEILIPRILISCILALGILYLILIGATFRRYSDPMEQAWQERIQGWLAEKAHAAAGYHGYHGHIGGHEQRNLDRASSQGPKLATKEPSATEAYPPPQKAGNSPPPAPELAKPTSARNFSSPPLQAEGPRSMTITHRPLPVPPGSGCSPEADHAPVGSRSLAKVEEKETRKTVSRTGPSSFNPFVSFIQTAQPREQAPTAMLSGSTKRLEVEGNMCTELSQPRLCGEPSGLTQIHETHSQTTALQERGLSSREAATETPRERARVAGASELEGMEVLLVLDWATRSIRAPQGARVAYTSPVTVGSLPPAKNPVPKRWLEVGLTVGAWEGFCTEVASSWVSVVNGHPGALAGMFAFINRWNVSLQAFYLAMIFVQSNLEGVELGTAGDGSGARNYSLYWGTRKDFCKEGTTES